MIIQMEIEVTDHDPTVLRAYLWRLQVKLQEAVDVVLQEGLDEGGLPAQWVHTSFVVTGGPQVGPPRLRPA